MSRKHTYSESLSEEQMKVIEAFNALPDGSQQERVVDILYDAMYERNLKKVLEQRLLFDRDRTITDQTDEIARLKRLVSYWMDKTKDSLNKELPIKAERRAERKELVKEILAEELFQNLTKNLKDLQSQVNTLKAQIAEK